MTDKKVINVVILASQNAILSTIASPMDMFLQAGVLWNITMGEKPSPLFDVKIVTADGCPITALNNFPVIPSCAMDDIEHLDLIVIPSQGFLFNPDDKHHIARIKWLQSWYERGADLASVCGGAFTLADTGLLDGKTATTHWGLAKQFNSRYPNVELRTDLLVTDEGRLFCGGGISADFSVRQFNRRFKSATGESVNSYMQLLRIDGAKVALVNSDAPFEEISIDTGYENISYFRRIFKRQTTLTPAQYRKRFK